MKTLLDLMDSDPPKRRPYNTAYHQKHRDEILARKRKYESENKSKRQLAIDIRLSQVQLGRRRISVGVQREFA